MIVVEDWIDYYDGLVVGVVAGEIWVVMGCDWETGRRSFARLPIAAGAREQLVRRGDFLIARELHTLVRDRAMPRVMELVVTKSGGTEVVGGHAVSSHAVRRELRHRARMEQRERLVPCQLEYADRLGARTRFLP